MGKSNFNYAGPGTCVGVQAGTVVISGAVRVGANGVTVDGEVLTDEDDE